MRHWLWLRLWRGHGPLLHVAPAIAGTVLKEGQHFIVVVKNKESFVNMLMLRCVATAGTAVLINAAASSHEPVPHTFELDNAHLAGLDVEDLPQLVDIDLLVAAEFGEHPAQLVAVEQAAVDVVPGRPHSVRQLGLIHG